MNNGLDLPVDTRLWLAILADRNGSATVTTDEKLINILTAPCNQAD